MFSPRFWLILWGALGSLGLMYVIFSASVKPDNGAGAFLSSSADETDAPGRYLIGDMADFNLTFPPRNGPEIPFTHQGRQLTLKSFRGQTVLVNFWATWCAPCLKELPSLDRLQGELQDEPFNVIAIAADPRGPEVAREYLDRLSIEHLDLYADQRLLMASAIGGANVLPVSILFSPDGTEIGRLVGEANWDSEEAKALIRAVIAGAKIRR